MSFRKVLFWLHLVAGLVAGLSIGIMCFTGVVLAYEKQIVSWSERDARRVPAPTAGQTRLSLDELTARVRTAHPDASPASIIVSADPRDAVTFSLGRDNTVFANPYTGAIQKPASTAVHDFMHVMEDWHRVLAFAG
ncbi:MAG TPA: PepSY domain-containing protein, partial [Opitutus sp.]|nr:PepSY domain-containing protein [Opitutus sp.]